MIRYDNELTVLPSIHIDTFLGSVRPFWMHPNTFFKSNHEIEYREDPDSIRRDPTK